MGEKCILDVKSELETASPLIDSATWRKRSISIYRVPEMFRDLHRKAYTPRLSSFGPYHHGRPHLMPMEPYKRRALLYFLTRSADKSLEEVVEAMRQQVQQLMSSYDMLDRQWRDDKNSFLELMILDGCFMLEMLEEIGDEINRYDNNDPVFSKPFVTSMLYSDMLMLENQQPLAVLSILAGFRRNKVMASSDAFL